MTAVANAVGPLQEQLEHLDVDHGVVDLRLLENSVLPVPVVHHFVDAPSIDVEEDVIESSRVWLLKK